MKLWPIIATFLFSQTILLFPEEGKEIGSLPTIKDKTNGMLEHAGFFNFYWDEKEGKIWLEIDKFETEILYVNSLPAGIGSNDIGLDRGQLGDSRIVKFQRIGPKVVAPVN